MFQIYTNMSTVILIAKTGVLRGTGYQQDLHLQGLNIDILLTHLKDSMWIEARYLARSIRTNEMQPICEAPYLMRRPT